MKKRILYGLLSLLTVGIGMRAYAQHTSSGKAASASAQSGQHQKMNVIFFLVDDMGWMDLGYQGSDFYETPNIDKFAKENVRFSQAYAACHVCSPSRASIIMGQYPARLHLTDWLPGRKEFPFQKLKNADVVQHLPYDQLSLPEVLKENGYSTAIIGKWHLGEDAASTSRQGFDVQIPDYNIGWPKGSYFSPFGMKGLDDGPKGEYLTDRITDEAVKYLEKNKDHPFFLYLAHFAVHDPIEGRPDLVEKYKKKLAKMNRKAHPFILEQNPDSDNQLSKDQLNALIKEKEYAGYGNLPGRMVKVKQFQDNPEFAAMVESVDESLKRIIDKVRELGIEDNTVIIFFSDNGGMSASNIGNPARKITEKQLDRAYSTSNLPLRGGKGWLYEGGIREPLIIKWPGHGKNGTAENIPVISTDFYPTILEMTGIAVPKVYPKDGMSLTPLWSGDNKRVEGIEDRALYWHFPQYSNHGAQSPGGAIRYGDYKLIEYFENFKVQLFDLKNDPGEHHDLASSMPKKVKELTKMLHSWQKKVKANMPTPNPDFDPALKDNWQKWKKPIVSN
ncbi:MAG TPA: sulfatase [Arachidicoccus sp.]|nr:sulfatase [Arachidicoccus sp.]